MKKVLAVIGIILGLTFLASSIINIVNSSNESTAVVASAEVEDVNYDYRIGSFNGSFVLPFFNHYNINNSMLIVDDNLYINFASTNNPHFTLYRIDNSTGDKFTLLNIESFDLSAQGSFIIPTVISQRSLPYRYWSTLSEVNLQNYNNLEIRFSNSGSWVEYYFYADYINIDDLNYLRIAFDWGNSLVYPGNDAFSTVATFNLQYFGSLEEIRQNAYDDGYAMGETYGYEEGYTQGFSDYVDGNGLTSIFVNGVNDLFRIEILPSTTISDVLGIGFGLLLMGICIKVFLGG